MSRISGADFNYNEIARYLEKLKQERQITDRNLGGLERERSTLDQQIAVRFLPLFYSLRTI